MTKVNPPLPSVATWKKIDGNPVFVKQNAYAGMTGIERNFSARKIHILFNRQRMRGRFEIIPEKPALDGARNRGETRHKKN